jgi:glucose-1-phosphatase
MTIRGVLFDIGGVLEITQPMDEARTWAPRLGLTPQEYADRTRNIWRGGSVGTLTLDQVHSGLAEALDTDAATVDALMADIWRLYLGVPNTELIAYARGLRPRYRTAILSNSFVGAREREQQAYGFEDLVDTIVYSHETGIPKPDPRSYEVACRRLGLPPEQVVFVDDVPACVDGARAYGLTGILFTDTADVIAELNRLLTH